MATNPGVFSTWPWRRLGSFKYLLLVPLAAQSVRHFVSRAEGQELDMLNLLIIPTQLARVLHSQLWISWSRFQTARSRHRIVDKSLDFEQVDRERNWDDEILLSTLFAYMANMVVPGASYLPWWNAKGVVLTAVAHTGPVEFIYYWFHRALHHHYLYSRYHSHHHASIVTEPITSVVHPFAEEIVYFLIFLIPIMATVFTGSASILGVVCYFFYIDIMNYMGHCNFELVPKRLFSVFPPLKYLMYTPSFHSLHHTQFRTNYSLFMPLYDYIYGTADRSTDSLYERCIEGREEALDVVHLTHPTSLLSVYHLRPGIACLASEPYASRWYQLWTVLLWPFTLCSLLFSRICASAFVVERNKLRSLCLQTWAIPRFSFQYALSWEGDAIICLIEKAVLEADERGAKVISLGLLNQGEETNGLGALYVRKHPKLRIRIVDGSSLAAAAVIHSIPRGTKEVLLRGRLNKVAYVVAKVLCQRSMKVIVVSREEFERLKLQLPMDLGRHLVLSEGFAPQVWLVGDGLTAEEQRKAAKGTCFIPFSQFPTKKARRDCVYYSTPAMVAPKDFENMHACENWLPRRVMSACRVAGILHASENWEQHEAGDAVLGLEEVWSAALKHGFLPLPSPSAQSD